MLFWCTYLMCFCFFVYFTVFLFCLNLQAISEILKTRSNWQNIESST